MKTPANFLVAHARVIVPLVLLMLATARLWDAVHSGDALNYGAAFGFASAALIFHLGERQRRRQPIVAAADEAAAPCAPP